MFQDRKINKQSTLPFQPKNELVPSLHLYSSGINLDEHFSAGMARLKEWVAPPSGSSGAAALAQKVP